MKLSEELRSSKKRTITIKNKDQKCFLWCHDKLINPVKIYPERLTRKDRKNLLKILIMMELNFLCEKKILAGNKKTTFSLTCFVTKTGWFFQFIFQI